MFLFALFRGYRLASTFVDFGTQIKQLKDAKQFRKAITLFDTHAQQPHTALTINQALKACIELNDLKRGTEIHQSLSSSLVNNVFIRTSLIRLYSKLFNETISTYSSD